MNMKSEVIEILDVINRELGNFAISNGNLPFNKIQENEDGDYVGSVAYDKFTLNFYFEQFADIGYSFMERPCTEDEPMFTKYISFLTRFKFDFSPITFSPYDIHNVIKSNEFVTLDFHEIENSDDAKQCLSVILNFIQRNIVAIRSVATDANMQNTLLENYFSDCRAMNKKFDKEKFFEDVEDSNFQHDAFLDWQVGLQDAINTFICTGNYSPLIKRSIKLEKKGKLLVFEKRYTDYLAQNGYPRPDTAVKEKRVNATKKNAWTSVVGCVSAAISLVISIIILTTAENHFIDKLPDGAFYLSSITVDLPLTFFVIGFTIIILRVLMAIPKLRIKTNYDSLFKDSKKWILKIALAVSLISFVIAGASIINYQKNEWAYLYNGEMYINEKVVDKSSVEIIHIQGYYSVDDNGNDVYLSGIDNEEFYLVFDGDYDDHILCDGLYGYDVDPTTAVKMLRQTGCKITSYKDYDEFLNSY